MYYTRDDLRYYWRIADDAFLSLYTTHAREKGKMRKRGIASSPPSSLSFFLGRLTHRKCQLRSSLSFHRSFPFTSPPSSFSSLPLSLSDISLSFSGSPSLFEGLSLSLSLPPSFSFSRSIGSREQAGMPPQEYEKCNKKGENCRHRSSGERERGRSAGVRGRNVKESVVNRPIYCLSSLFPSSRSGQFRIFNWTTRYSLPILSLSSRFFFPVRARYRPTWLGHFTSLIWELCGEIGRSLIGTRVYTISRRAWWNSKFPIYSKKESRYRGYIVRIGYVLWRSGGGEKNGKKKKKRSLWSPPDADRHSRIRFYLSDISATDLLILVTGEVHQGILVRRPDIWYRRKMIENINIYFLISYQKL